MLFKSKANILVSSLIQCWTPTLFFPRSFPKATRFQSFMKKVFDCMKGLMKKSINRLGIAYRVINKTLKESFQMWLYVFCPHWVKANLFTLLPHPCYLSIHSLTVGLQIKEGSMWTKQRLWQSFGHLQQTEPFFFFFCSGSIKQGPSDLRMGGMEEEAWQILVMTSI